MWSRTSTVPLRSTDAQVGTAIATLVQVLVPLTGEVESAFPPAADGLLELVVLRDVEREGGPRVPIDPSQHLGEHRRVEAAVLLGGQFEQPVIVENHSQTPCELGGWPALAVIDPAGRPISTTNAFLGRYNPSLPEWPTVLLEPGGRASFAVMGEDYNTVDDRTCPQSSSWRVDLPSVARPIEVSARRPACEGSKGITFEVTPLLPGLSMKRFQDFSQFTGSATCDERCSPSW